MHLEEKISVGLFTVRAHKSINSSVRTSAGAQVVRHRNVTAMRPCGNGSEALLFGDALKQMKTKSK